jgi:hypothetical protein
MRLHRLARHTTSLLTAVLATVTLAAVGTASGGTATQRPVDATTVTNAAKIHHWGLSQWHYGFTETRLSSDWKVASSPGTDGTGLFRPRQVNLQHGMLTINGTADAVSGSAELLGHARVSGRWETRLRSKQYSTSGRRYRVVAALVPSPGHPDHCGARDINYAKFTIGSSRANLDIHNLPDVLDHYGKNLDPTQWHDYAVEVTSTHVSWFVDGQVVTTDRRPDALSGVPLDVSFRLEATDGSGINPGRMQMDWIRYYTMARGITTGLPAPQPYRSRFAGAC